MRQAEKTRKPCFGVRRYELGRADRCGNADGLRGGHQAAALTGEKTQGTGLGVPQRQLLARPRVDTGGDGSRAVLVMVEACIVKRRNGQERKETDEGGPPDRCTVPETCHQKTRRGNLRPAGSDVNGTDRPRRACAPLPQRRPRSPRGWASAARTGPYIPRLSSPIAGWAFDASSAARAIAAGSSSSSSRARSTIPFSAATAPP